MPVHLILKAEEPVAFALDKPIMLIGRSDDCDIILRKTMKLSRRHCCIAQVNGKLVIRDLGSMNGIKVNGSRVLEAELKEGDELTLGDLQFTFTHSQKLTAGVKGAKNSGAQKVVEQPKAEKKPAKAVPPPLDLSMDFPQIVHDDNDPEPLVDRETPLTSKLPLVKPTGSKRPASKSSGETPASHRSKLQGSGGGSQAELLDSGDLDVGGLEQD